MRRPEPSCLSRRGSGLFRRRPALLALSVILLTGHARPARAHDIPNARVDRSIQVVLRPGTLAITYEVSLSELTLTQELRSLIGSLPGAGRGDWFAAYGRETGPLNAKGILVWNDGQPVDLRVEGFDLSVEEHPRFLFHFTAGLPARGRLRVRDTNFASSEGTSRLAVKGEGVAVLGDDLPPDVESIPARPVWQLSDEEERRTKEVTLEFGSAGDTEVARGAPRPPVVKPAPSRPTSSPAGSPLSRLMDDALRRPVAVLALLAFVLGAAHAFQPGHGKTLVAATVVSEGGRWGRGAVLALLTTLTHAGSVFLVAAALWWTGSVAFVGVHEALTRASGFLIAAVGLWRVGRVSAGFAEHERGAEPGVTRPAGRGGLVGLGMAGGLVPCWDAVGLVLLAAAVDRLGLGLILVGAFSAGMGAVLVLFGWVVSRMRDAFAAIRGGEVWERRLGLASGVVLSGLGIFLLRS